MTEAWVQLVLGTAFFLAIHFGIAGTTLRDSLVVRLGEAGYLGAFSLLSGVGLAWMITGYLLAPYAHVYASGPGLRHATLLLTALGFVLVVSGLTTPNPTQVGSVGLLGESRGGEAARGVLRITRHPFLVGVGLWAVAHLLANGDAASLVFFGGFALLAFLGTLSIDRRKARLATPGWAEYAASTSIVPFAAVVSGRNELHLGELSWRPLLGLGVFVAALLLHTRVIGVSPLPS